MNKGLTFGDKILFATLVCTMVVSFIVVEALAFRGSDVVIEVGGTPVQKLQIGIQDTVSIDGLNGRVTVETRDGKVAVTDAACPNQICVRTGWRARAGEVIVCVPNHVVVRILGQREKGVRAITG
ncbi:MAG: NusG domain II-containing protein [Bacteroidota bacterium]